ncbi:hypothetical protein [Halovenus salina]|uniref:Pyridine nucleotide-disulphide oxidoreductase dimerisation domain-containing protein n=1 Tax=Halovenus salina TaxID=1510225 RepID=A0ABD5W1S7_9EURY
MEKRHRRVDRRRVRRCRSLNRGQAASTRRSTASSHYPRGDDSIKEVLINVLICLESEIRDCHIIGPDASALVQEIVAAMKAETETVQDIQEAVHSHPVLTEVVNCVFSALLPL